MNTNWIDEDVPADAAHIAAIAAHDAASGHTPITSVVADALPYSGAGKAEAEHVLDRLEAAGFEVSRIGSKADEAAMVSMANELRATREHLLQVTADKTRAIIMLNAATTEIENVKAELTKQRMNFDALVAAVHQARAERDSLSEEIERIVTAVADALGIDPSDIDGDGDQGSIIVAHINELARMIDRARVELKRHQHGGTRFS